MKRTPEANAKIREAKLNIHKLRGWIGRSQLAVVGDAMRGEEAEFFADKMLEFIRIIESMPSTGQTDGQGDAAIVHLHYFAGGQANFYITEKDKGAPDDEPEQFQSQAFGLADLYQDGGELGYISIPEILSCGGELDFYWKPKSLDAIREKAEDKKPDTSEKFKAELARETGAELHEVGLFDEMAGV